MRFPLIATLLLTFSSFAQINFDSLNAVWNDPSSPDTSKLKALDAIAWKGYLFSQPDSAFMYADSLYQFAESIENLDFMAKARNIQGIAHYFRSDYDLALKHYSMSLEIRRKMKDGEKGIAALLNNIAMIEFNQGYYDKAIEHLMEALLIEEKYGDPKSIASTLGNVGLIYKDQGDYERAIDYYNQSLDMLKGLPEETTYRANALSNLGVVYLNTNEYDLALEHFLKCKEIQTKSNDLNGLAHTIHNIGVVYQSKEDFPLALKYFRECMELESAAGDKLGLAGSHNEIAMVYRDMGKYSLAEQHASEALKLSLEVGLAVEKSKAYKTLYYLYKRKGLASKALDMFEYYVAIQDSLRSEENRQAVIRQEYQYKYEKQLATDSIETVVKTREAKKLTDAKLDAKQAELESEKSKQYLLYGGLGLLAFVISIIYWRYRTVNSQKKIIEEQKSEVDYQRELAEEKSEQLEVKNKEILDSITYAKRIQSAILPPSKVVKEYLNESFILYKPKDIVAGDFYWLEHIDGKILLAACDCTGHGVPGAMVSVVCNNGLNRAVREHNLSIPGKILDKTRDIVISEFEKSEEDVMDGMDVALVSLDTNSSNIQFAGAMNPLWIIRKDSSEVEELKGDKQPIGKYANTVSYQTQSSTLNSGDTIYLFSDGYIDQFGGEKGKKFKASAFKELLISIQSENMDRQRELIDEAFEKWRGELEQLDDVCVIGVRV